MMIIIIIIINLTDHLIGDPGQISNFYFFILNPTVN
jgi:hypothetical protein